MEKYLVIGSNSFSGSHFLSLLLRKGYQCFAVSRSNELKEVFCPYKWDTKNKPRFFKYDINKDANKIIDLIKKNKIGYIINFAAQSMVAQSWDTPEDWYQTNIIGQVNILNKLKDFDFINNYLHVTTPEVYGSTEGWIKENSFYNPSTPYAISRATLDMHLQAMHQVYNFPVVFTRAANVYGPGQPLYRIIPRTLFFARTNKVLYLDGGGKSIRSFIHIDDITSATYEIMKKGKIGTCYHISTDNLISIKDLVEKIAYMTQIDFKSFVKISEERLGKDQAYKLDSSYLKNDLGWKPKINLEEGLKNTLGWIDKNLSVLKNENLNYEHKK